jgi:hypothetical protein
VNFAKLFVSVNENGIVIPAENVEYSCDLFLNISST